jgi:hypothetical protein
MTYTTELPNLPMELINKILIMRPTHPVAVLINNLTAFAILSTDYEEKPTDLISLLEIAGGGTVFGNHHIGDKYDIADDYEQLHYSSIVVKDFNTIYTTYFGENWKNLNKEEEEVEYEVVQSFNNFDVVRMIRVA